MLFVEAKKDHVNVTDILSSPDITLYDKLLQTRKEEMMQQWSQEKTLTGEQMTPNLSKESKTEPNKKLKVIQSHYKS